MRWWGKMARGRAPCAGFCAELRARRGEDGGCGDAFAPGSRKEAEHAGVRMVMQELNLLPTLTVAENIFIDSMPRRMGIIDYRTMNAAAKRAIDAVGLQNVEPDQLISSLGVGQQQLVEIAAALSRKCDVLVLDEPTAALTAPEIELLFAQIRRLKTAGVGIIYVSHRMEEIRAITDRITVLRDGQWVATRDTAQMSHEETVRLMVGRDLSEMKMRDSAAAGAGEVAMSVRGLCSGIVRDVSFDARRGKILGFAGLMGSGRTETMRAIFGADRKEAGAIFLAGKKSRSRHDTTMNAKGELVLAQIRTPRDAVKLGIALLTEDRKSQGLILPLEIAANVSLPRMSTVARLGAWIDRRKEEQTAEQYVKAISIRCRSVRQAARELSGGNQQKIVLAKWLLRDCDVLIFDEPTRGIDVGAKFEIYKLLNDLAARESGDRGVIGPAGADGDRRSHRRDVGRADRADV